MLKNLTASLVEHERIQTTVSRAKAMKKVGDWMISLGKRGNWKARMDANWWIRNDSLVDKLFGPLTERYESRPGGYTRVLRIPNRKGDQAPMAIIEYINNPIPSLLPAKGGDAHKAAERKKLRKIPKEGTPV
ncbi:large ribosomal subunit protein bL17-like [Oscarella lobularis]|uniref:large ribosomal subunit protein bL17-like n=1 Tax=Oscarella lobularis TaxID=121494 RepID=UPI0033142F48